MGSPVSSFLPETATQRLNTWAITKSNGISLWERYFDDVYATEKTNKINDVLQVINTTTENMSFKNEEQDNKLAFLHVLLTKTANGTHHALVFRKSTHTDQIPNYHRNNSTQHKISSLKPLYNRIDIHCNSQEAKEGEQKCFSEISGRMTTRKTSSKEWHKKRNAH